MPPPTDPLPTIIRQALTTTHAHLALTHGHARRYPADVAPFAALEQPTPTALHDLAALLEPGESTYLLGEKPHAIPGLNWEAVVPCLQMVFPEDASLPQARNHTIQPLACANSPAMLDLIALAYPGYFRPQTCRMGRSFGIRAPDSTLLAMGCERLIAHPWREISGLCTHPAHPGRGLGAAILCHLLALHRAEGAQSWLWVTEANHRAAALYHRLGFQTLHRSVLHRVQKPLDPAA